MPLSKSLRLYNPFTFAAAAATAMLMVIPSKYVIRFPLLHTQPSTSSAQQRPRCRRGSSVSDAGSRGDDVAPPPSPSSIDTAAAPATVARIQTKNFTAAPMRMVGRTCSRDPRASGADSEVRQCRSSSTAPEMDAASGEHQCGTNAILCRATCLYVQDDLRGGEALGKAHQRRPPAQSAMMVC